MIRGLWVGLWLSCVPWLSGQEIPRVPAVPLVACDPYFSIWSAHDRLNSGETTHWTGRPHRLECDLQLDGRAFRVLGKASAGQVLPQTGLSLTPTRTVATFTGQGVRLEMTFFTPALPEDLDVLSRPVTYVVWNAIATDGQEHELQITLTASGEIAVNQGEQRVRMESVAIPGLAVARVGSVDQPVLAQAGDDLRIDWGYLYLAGSQSQGAESRIFPEGDRAWPAADTRLQLQIPLGRVGSQSVRRWALLAYDDLYSIQYLQNNLRPYWRRTGWEAADLLRVSADQFEELWERAVEFDRELLGDLERAGGDAYARLGALAYRQCFAAGKFVADAHGQPLQFSKENHSNGCIATSDVFYPMAPQFLLFGPSLAKSFLVPFMNYAADDRWKFPFAPHDLGTYPWANGQRYGGGERSEENQMPVEESGNLLLLFAAVAEMEGHAEFAGLYWPQLTRWAEYLRDKGFDPENQLCTDDFAGHLAHNVNLSIKAICGLGAYARLCSLRGEVQRAAEYRQLAQEFAERWIAASDDGDHSRLAFDRPGTWSQKYNLVWDRLLDLNLFPDSVRRREMDFYLRQQNEFGLPLDNRKEYTKLDWILWTATLTQDRRDFDALLAPVDRFLRETPDRSPLTDWYETRTARKVGFTARPVVGGVFLQLLYDRAVWKKYAQRDRTGAAGWAPLPQPPRIEVLLPAADSQPQSWSFTTAQPAEGWFAEDFDDSQWERGPGGFGTPETPGSIIGTNWNSAALWLRRSFELPQSDFSQREWDDVELWIHHDEDAEIFLNGVLAARLRGYTTEYRSVPIAPAARAALRAGSNTLAIHVQQTRGGQYLDAGLIRKKPVPAEK